MTKLFRVLVVLLLGMSGVAKAQTDSVPSHTMITSVTLLGDSTPTVSLTFGFIGKLSPPAIYKKWWLETMHCAKLKISLQDRQRIKYYWVTGPFAVNFAYPSSRFAGYSEVWNNRLYITQENLVNPHIVKHEMLHYILWHHGVMGHPPEYFITRCDLG